MEFEKRIKNGLSECSQGSSPSFGTENLDNSHELTGFLHSIGKPWQIVAEKFPYELCRLVHYDFDLSKRWYVIYRAWNVATEQLERKRISDPMNKKKTVRGRLEIAKQIIEKTNADLKAGKVLGKNQVAEISKTIKDELHKKTLLQCIDYFVEKKREQKRRKNYLRGFDRLKFHIEAYYAIRKITDIPIRKIDGAFFDDFFNSYLLPLCQSKTFNNYRNDLTTVLKFIKKQSPGALKKKPWKAVTRLKVVSKKHAAYSDGHVQLILNKANEMGFPGLVLFCQFEYYTLARPAEILSIRIRDIDLMNHRIIIHGEDAKNWRDEFVTIPDRFKEIIIASGIMEGEPSDYVFGWQPKEKGKRAMSTGRPGPIRHNNEVPFYSKLVKVLDELDLYKINSNFSLYSFKHSGAIALFLETLDITAVMEQCRHKSIQQTSDYLRDLGLLRNESPVRKFKGAA
jgi:integrase